MFFDSQQLMPAAPRSNAAGNRRTVSLPANGNGASARGKHMADQVTNQSAVAEQSQVRVLRMALPSSA
jgi:hypothetical protein